MILGDYFDALGDGVQAGDHYRAALGEAGALGLEEIRWEASFGLARAAERRGRTEEAAGFYKQTIALIEQITIGLPLRTFRSSFRLDKIGLYETLMRLLLQMDRAAPGKGFDREAFLFAEKSKARGFLAGLLSPDEDVAPGAEPGLRAEERRIHRAITLIQLGLQAPTIALGRRRALLHRLDTAESERRDFLVRIRKRDAAAFRFHYIQPYDCAAVQERLLGPATALLEYVIGEEFSAAFLLTRAGLTVAPLPPPVRPESAGGQLPQVPDPGRTRGFSGAFGRRPSGSSPARALPGDVGTRHQEPHRHPRRAAPLSAL